MERHGNYKRAALESGLTLAAFALLTGAATGVVVTLYNVLIGYAEHAAVTAYGEIFSRPYFIPLLLAALALVALVAGTAVRLVPMIRGSGIPQTEGAARGLFRLKWFSAMCTMFAVSLAAALMGLSAGAEGPSVLMGGCLGEGAGRLTKRGREDERTLVSAGAGAGFAVAFNAPLTGVLFSVEEASKRINPRLVIAALCSVVSGLAVRGGLRSLISLADPEIDPLSSAFSAFDLTVVDTFAEIMLATGLVLIAAAAAALLGAAFFHSVFALRALFSKITPLGGAGKLIIPFVLAGAFGMVSPLVMTGGHDVIQSVGTQGGITEMSTYLRFSSPLAAAIAVILLLRFIATACNMGAGVPCGAFVPMIAIAACFGGLLSCAMTAAGMPPEYSDIIVISTVTAFFAAVVKAPVSAAVMAFELTGSYNFALLLPVAAASAAAYLISSALRIKPIYDCLLTTFV